MLPLGMQDRLTHWENGVSLADEAANCLCTFKSGHQPISPPATLKWHPDPVSSPFEGYKFYGLNRGEHEGKAGLWYREWAPAAKVGQCPPPPPHTHT